MHIIRTHPPDSFNIHEPRNNRFTVAVLAILPDNVSLPMVQDLRKPIPTYIKLPGGESKCGETVRGAALRELEEETGARVKTLTLFRVEERENKDGTGTHFVFYLAGFVTDFENGHRLKTRGDEGEIVHRYEQKELPRLVDLFEPHRIALFEAGFIPAP